MPAVRADPDRVVLVGGLVFVAFALGAVVVALLTGGA